ncbi:MAG: hypothetical protein ACI9NT_000468 [Bacteroidia bacterium]|jgi:hypothetical protein
MKKTFMMRILLVVLLLLPALLAAAHDEPKLEATTHDGRDVILLEDHTWSFLEYEPGDPEKSAVLTILKVVEMDDACRLEMHLQNNLDFKIRSLVPRFSVFNQRGVLFEAKSKGFSAIKTTKDQYGNLQFSGIGCRDISRIKIHGAARCTMGAIDMFNEEEGECLDHLYVVPTDLINISK